MTKDTVSNKINAILTKAGWDGKSCGTCGKAVASPYRQYDRISGKIMYGCVDPAHSGHLYGESLRWHNSKGAFPDIGIPLGTYVKKTAGGTWGKKVFSPQHHLG
jgi:hypothetical protein